MVELATVHQMGRPLQIKRLAAAHRIPQQFLVQILLQLKSTGLVRSTRGAAGGYALALPPAEISLGDVVRAIEGPHATPENANQSPLALALHATWREIYRRQWEHLDSTSLADLADRVPQAAESMYYI